MSVLSGPRTRRGVDAASHAQDLMWNDPTLPGECRACNGLGEVPTYRDEFGNYETGPCLRCHETGRAT